MSIPSWYADHLASLSPVERAEFVERLRVKLDAQLRLRFCPAFIDPTPKQQTFLAMNCLEAFYGGAAGPGKSTALLLAALQYVDVPGYTALLLRRTYNDLMLPGALMDMAQQWLSGTNATYSASLKTWRFPSSATLTFGHLQHEEQKRRYAGSEFCFVGFDELTQFTETQYTFLFSRLRRPKHTRRGSSPDGLGLADVPLRMRSASNPGGFGHDWVRERFVDAETREVRRRFVPARMTENPHLDTEAYMASLAELTPAERERLADGDWEAVDDGGVFSPDLWPILERRPEWSGRQSVRMWDMAGSVPSPAYPDPDYTVGTLYDRDPLTGQNCVSDVIRVRITPADTEELVAATARADGRGVPVGIEQEPGAAGVALISRYSRHVLRSLTSVHAVRPSGDKVTRARTVSAAAGRGEVSLVRAAWNRDFRSELRRFPAVRHDDQVDTLSAAHEWVGRLSAQVVASMATARIPTGLAQGRRTA